MSATFAEKGVHEPDFAVGDTVWIIESKQEEVSHDCPDCKGTKRWCAISPAGTEHEIDCPRCSGSYSRIGGLRDNEIPALKYRRTKYVAVEQKVAAIKIDDAGWRGDKPDSYRLNGSGHYNRNVVYATEAEALAVADIKTAESDAKLAGQPHVLAAMRFKDVDIVNTAIAVLKGSLWDSWYAYRNLREEGETLLDDEQPYNGWSKDQRVEWFKDHELSRDRNRYIDYGPAFDFMDYLSQGIASGEITDPVLIEKHQALDRLFLKGE